MNNQAGEVRWGLSLSALLAISLLAGRLTGLLRELELASLFGVTRDADVAILLLTIPDLLVSLLISGGLTAALVPRFSSLQIEQALALFQQVSVGVFLFFGVIGLILVAWPQKVFFLLAPGVHWPFTAGSVVLFFIAIALSLTSLSGVAGAFLNANHRFFATGCGTLIFNVCVLLSLLLARNSPEPLLFLAFGIFVGAATRWISQLATLPSRVWRPKVPRLLLDTTLIQSFIAATLASTCMLAAPISIRAMASTLGDGAIASFNYAQKLIELPVGVLITSISTVALPRLSTLYANNMSVEAAISATRDTQYALLVAIAVMVPGIWFADSVVHVIFSRGRMDAEALLRVTDLTRVALLGIPFIAISSMAIALLNANQRNRQVLKVTIGSLLLLPLLSLPGLLLASDRSLMVAVVGFHVIAAVWLANSAKQRFFGPDGVLAFSTWNYFAAVIGAAVLVAGLDWGMGLQNHWLRLLLAACGFAFTLLVPVRHHRWLSVKPNSTIDKV